MTCMAGKGRRRMMPRRVRLLLVALCCGPLCSPLPSRAELPTGTDPPVEIGRSGAPGTATVLAKSPSGAELTRASEGVRLRLPPERHASARQPRASAARRQGRSAAARRCQYPARRLLHLQDGGRDRCEPPS
jgi:hypothetical protein